MSYTFICFTLCHGFFACSSLCVPTYYLQGRLMFFSRRRRNSSLCAHRGCVKVIKLQCRFSFYLLGIWASSYSNSLWIGLYDPLVFYLSSRFQTSFNRVSNKHSLVLGLCGFNSLIWVGPLVFDHI